MAAAAAAAATLERLEALSCPPVAPVAPLEPAQALRLLCTPSPRRLALLEWLCARVHPPLAARLDALRDGPKDARLRELAKLGAELMLCRADDMALVEGTAPPEQQLEFIRDLLAAAPPRGGESEGSPRSRHRALHRTAKFLHELLETPEGGAALSPPCPPRRPPATTTSPPPRPGDPPVPRGRSWRRRWGRRGSTWSCWRRRALSWGGHRARPPLPARPGGGGARPGRLGHGFRGDGAAGPPGTPGFGGGRVLAPCGPLAPPVWQGLRQLVQSLGVVAQLGDTVAEVTRLAGGTRRQAMETRMATLRQRFGDVPKVWGD